MKKILIILIVLCTVINSCKTKTHIKPTHVDRTTKTRMASKEKINVSVTMYYATIGQCDNTPLITACGYKINPKRASEHKWIAVSRDLLKTFKYGDKVLLSNAGEKDGIYTIADTMHKRFKQKIDILETKDTPLYKLKNVVLTKV